MINLASDEKLIFVVRKHWLVLARRVFFLDLFIFVPFLAAFIYVIGVRNFIQIPGEGISLFVLITAVWLLGLWATFFIIWTDYYLDMLVLTAKRLMHIEQKGLFSREVSTLQLNKIQDITTEVHGIIQTLLKFGEIHIQTAGQEREFVVKDIPQPYKVRDTILRETEPPPVPKP